MEKPIHYPGNELALFEGARRWKKYFSQQIKPYIQGKVLEVGAGIGGTTIHLDNARIRTWVLLEPDPEMVKKLEEKKSAGKLPSHTQIQQGTIDSLSISDFDVILYIDVLEHIENDREEIVKATSLLRTGGKLIVLSPAFNQLYSPFDKAIGHYRRYDKKSLTALAPQGLSLVSVKYLDLLGMMLSWGNRWITRKPYPSKGQIQFWDRVLVPVSKILDRLTGFSRGRSILAVWERKQ